MASLTITVPDPLVPRIAAAARFDLTENHQEDVSGYTDAQVVRYWTKRNWQSYTSSYEAGVAGRAQYDQTEQEMEAIE